MMIKVKIVAPVKGTEDPEKVKKAILNLFMVDKNKIELIKDNHESRIAIVAEGKDVLLPFFDAIRYDRIIDSARRILKRNQVGNTTFFYISKEAAFVKHVNFTEEGQEPLGAIFVTIISDELDRVIKWLTPKTKDGKIIETIDLNDD